MKTLLLALGAALVLLPAYARAGQVPMSAEAAFDKASRQLVAMGAMPTFRDKELLVIKTDPVPVKLTQAQGDCGKMFGIPYLKDKRTKVAATYQVSINPIDAGHADVSVKVSLQGYMDVNEGAPFFIEKTRDSTKVLNCTSNGWLEQQFLSQLAQA